MATQRGRPRKASTAASHPPQPTAGPSNAGPSGNAPGAPSVDASAASTGGGGISTMPPPSFNSAGPTTAADCESIALQLVDPNTNLRRKLDIANELRDSAENTRDFAFYEKYLGALIPAVITVLSDEKAISFMKDNLDHVSHCEIERRNELLITASQEYLVVVSAAIAT